MNNNEYNKYLPIGTVVLLKDAKKRLMITGFCMISKEDSSKMFDYCGCIYPEGIVDPEKMILFNHSQIDKIYYLGLKDQEEIEFKGKITQLLQNNSNNLNTQNNSVMPQMFSNNITV